MVRFLLFAFDLKAKQAKAKHVRAPDSCTTARSTPFKASTALPSVDLPNPPVQFCRVKTRRAWRHAGGIGHHDPNRTDDEVGKAAPKERERERERKRDREEQE